MSNLSIRAPLAWLGTGGLTADVQIDLDGGVIASVGRVHPLPQDTDLVAADGIVMPAAADRHVHIALADPGAVLLGGVTAVRDLGWPPEEIFPLAAASEGPSFNGPLIRAAGPMITVPGGYPTRSEWAPEGTGLEVRGPEEATHAVEKLADDGAAHVKVSLNADAGPTPTDEELVAIVECAHRRDLFVTAHVQGRGQAERAVGAGIDEIAHAPWTEHLSDELLEQMAKSMRIVSTLDIHCYGVDTPELRAATDNLWRFARAGGKVLYGTDLGNGPIPPGIDLREVLMLWEAGLGAEAVLEAMMRSPLEAGAPADMIGVARNPFEDIEALGELKLVMRTGRVVLQR